MRLAVITGSRADFGLLLPLLKRLKAHERFELQLIACAGHLVPSQGLTIEAIKAEGFTLAAEIDMVLASNTPQAMSKAIGLGVLSFTDAFTHLKTESLLVLGDRFEVFAAAIAAVSLNLPIIHLEGGQRTLGAVDEVMRHAISKMAHLHFTACETYRQRLIHMGEQPMRVFNVGATGLEHLPQKPRDVLSQELAHDFSKPFLLVTLHSETANSVITPRDMAQMLCNALAKTPFDLIFTGSNTDTGGDAINVYLQDFVAKDPAQRKFYASLGHENYLSLARFAACVVGNSSSGVIEIPSFGVPTLTIGQRQAGRIHPQSVVNCDFDLIKEGLKTALSPTHLALAKQKINPFYQPKPSQTMLSLLEQTQFSTLIPKEFYDVF